MRIRFRHVKDVAIHPTHWLVRGGGLLPESLRRLYFRSFGLLGKAYYFTPYNHARRTMDNFCRMTGRSDSQEVYFRMVDNLLFVASAFGRLMSDGTDSVADMVAFDEPSVARTEAVRAKYGAGILLVPHCAASVLSAAGFGRRYPALVLVRESRSMRRHLLMRRYFDKLGPELLFVRRTDPGVVARGILRALHQKKFVIGTTDLARNGPDTVEVKFFGQPVPLPAWPARFSARRKIPILPGYIRVTGGRIVLSLRRAVHRAGRRRRDAALGRVFREEHPRVARRLGLHARQALVVRDRQGRLGLTALAPGRRSLTLRGAVD